MTLKHLVVFVHGFYGLPRCFNYSSRLLQEKLGPTALLYISRINNAFVKGTEDGIDKAGIRLASEVTEVVSKHNTLEEISFVSVSMGGLTIRYALGLLYRESDSTIAGLKPNSYYSFVTPHLGARVHAGWMAEKVLSYFPLVRPTCDHFFFRDAAKNESKVPLLVEMTNPNSSYFKGLASFRKRVAYSNVENDHRTSYQSGAIYPYQFTPPYSYHPDYPTVLTSKEDNNSNLVPFYNEQSEEWIAAENLSKLEWIRVGCHFKGWFASWMNHSNIIVSVEILNGIGKSAVAHFVDAFSE